MPAANANLLFLHMTMTNSKAHWLLWSLYTIKYCFSLANLCLYFLFLHYCKLCYIKLLLFCKQCKIINLNLVST